MKLVKSLLLASAAGLAAVSGASAADLGGIKKPAPAEYVRVCNAYGAGFFYIPGTQTCLRVSGRARFESQYTEQFNRTDSKMGWRALGVVALDARTQSEYGPVRAFVRIFNWYRTGSLYSGSANRYYGAGNGAYIANGNGINVQAYTELESAFVQFGGLTAGKVTSFFDFGAGAAHSWIGIGGAGTFSPVQLAYTATFGSGFSATLALEDPTARRNVVGSYAGGAPATFGYGGSSVPDVVGVLRVDQGWGSAQLSGLIHQVNYPATVGLGAANGAGPDSDYGFAIQGGVKFKLPMLAAGDEIYLQGGYTKGAINTLIGVDCGGHSAGQCDIGKGNSFTGNLRYYDAAYNALTTGATKLTTGYGATASFLHYWTPTIRQSIWGSYTKIDYAASTLIADTSLWRVGSNVTWSPIAGLDLGGEVYYSNIHGGSGFAGNGTTKFTPGAGGSSQGQWQFRLRVQRDF